MLVILSLVVQLYVDAAGTEGILGTVSVSLAAGVVALGIALLTA